ncbi:MAG: hypothetical protein LOY01_14220 [Brachybacterium paraconglomeratum]|nr:hypothetical protein [Brachybacterium paraconglomeratum]
MAAVLRCGPSVVDPLLAKVETGSRQERLAAAALLGRIGSRRAINVPRPGRLTRSP